MRSGRTENIPYSLSRWTDLPISKWNWFRQQLRQGWMVAFDQRMPVPARWSLRPEDTLGLIFWTKDPTNLVRDASLLQGYRVKIHITVTGWHEVEKGAPGIEAAASNLAKAVETFGAENVTWRFTPIPAVPDVVSRFKAIASIAGQAGLRRVFLAFLQDNDLMPETRSVEARRILLVELAEAAKTYQIEVLLCQDDTVLLNGFSAPNLNLGICAPPEDFAPSEERDTCGCGFAVDPFSINETCRLGCTYCYAADKNLSPKKHNTT